MKIFFTWDNIPKNFEGHCYIKEDEGERWLKPGRKRHRVDGPAVIYKMGTQHWFYEDKKHRLDGPATIYASLPAKTFKDLKKILNGFTEEQLDNDVSIFLSGPGEYCSIRSVSFAVKDESVLDAGHPYIDMND